MANAVSGSGGGGGGAAPYIQQGLAISDAGTSDGIQNSNHMMGDIGKMSAAQMKQQTEMGLLQMIVKLNEALAKVMKALGDAIKGLV